MLRLQFNPEHLGQGQWDQSLVNDLFGDIEGHIFIIPGEYEGGYVDRINQELNKYPYAVVLVLSDENSNFPVKSLQHPRMKVWMQYPKGWHEVDHYLPAGYSPIKVQPAEKTLDWFWGGQVTHQDRYELVEQLRKMDGGFLIESEGFTQGIDLADYLDLMAKAKIVPCPRGSVSPDTMRMYDALELGCTPVICQRDETFFKKILGDFSFPVIGNWSDLAGVEYRDCREWWAAYKGSMVEQMKEDIECLKQ